MTGEEAIEQLEFMLEQMPEEPPTECDYIDEWLDTNRKIRNTLDMAIKSLGQEPCEDAVSRKAVVNLILEDAVRTGIGHRYTSIQNMNNEINEVRSLPSVTPTRKKGKWIPCRANEECPLKESEEK